MRSKIRKEDVCRIICYVVFGVVASFCIIAWNKKVMTVFERQENLIAFYEDHVAVLQAADNCLPTPLPTTNGGYY